MKKNNKTYKTFLGYIYGEARESEVKDINGNPKSFIFKNCRILLGIIISIVLLICLPKGYDDSFLQLVTTIVSIFIGLFLTTLVFALDKFYKPNRCKIGDYNLEILHKDHRSKYELSLDEIKHLNAKEKKFQRQSYHYLKQFVVLIGKCVIVSVWTLVLVCLYIVFYDNFSIDIYKYICTKNWMIKLPVIIFVRFMISYYLVEIFYDTVKIISSMVNFMMAKIEQE